MVSLKNKLGLIIKYGVIARYGLSDAGIECHEVMRTQHTAPMSNGAALTLIKIAGAPGMTLAELATEARI